MREVYRAPCVHCGRPTQVAKGYEPAECGPCWIARNPRRRSGYGRKRVGNMLESKEKSL